MLTRILVILLSSVAATACGGDRARDETPAKLAAIDTSRVNVSAGSVTRRAARTRGDTNAYPAVRGLYLNRFAPQSVRKMRHLFAIADSTEINAFVIDMKDEFGLNYHSAKPEIARNAGGTHGFVNDVRALVDSVKAHGLIPIARLVAFKDPVSAEKNPDWQIRQEDGSTWRDKQGLAWVNAHDKRVWEYNLAIAEELVALGFEEIQWDYIRFPEPYKSLPTQVFPGASMSKPDALASFLKESRQRLSKLGVRTTADIFGLVTSVRGTLEVGQNWEKLSPVTDVLLPMVYPSHYPRGSLGVAHPNGQPYDIIKIALDTARVRDQKLGITKPEHVRPWLQAFSLGQPKYGPEQVAAQKKAVYDAGYNGWILWSPGSMYDVYVPALDKKSRPDSLVAR
ncbi:MAG TPA: putative glycoside hydrolase [Gemmatimonadaceae bacterium]|nr:putative glycoside hydrolase [Gemmatimonadaceae bacterium]